MPGTLASITLDVLLIEHIQTLYLSYAGRPASAAAAAGYMSLHIEQQEQLVVDALYGSGEEEG